MGSALWGFFLALSFSLCVSLGAIAFCHLLEQIPSENTGFDLCMRQLF